MRDSVKFAILIGFALILVGWALAESETHNRKSNATMTAFAAQRRSPTPRIQALPTIDLSHISCSDAMYYVGEHITCFINYAYCDYYPETSGKPTFCNNIPYPDQTFTVVLWNRDGSILNGRCIWVSGRVVMFDGLPQMVVQPEEAFNFRYCN